jgi:uncharacterized protein
MFESLGRIQNPFVRSLTAALTTLSVITIVSSFAIGATKPKDDAYKVALYSALLGTGCGALLGLAYTNQGNQQKAALNNQQSTPSSNTAWKDWRNFVVV